MIDFLQMTIFYTVNNFKKLVFKLYTFCIKINKDNFDYRKNALVAQLGKALSWYDRDRWFKSSRLLFGISTFLHLYIEMKVLSLEELLSNSSLTIYIKIINQIVMI